MASTSDLSENAMDNELTNEETKKASKECYSLEVLRLIKEAQMQHGLRHGDYQRYRQYCSRRIRRTRKALHFPQGTKHKVQPKKITAEQVKDSRYLLLLLIDAERAWAYAMQLKTEANTEPRKRFHMVNRLRKAVKHADSLNRLCNDCGLFDARSKLEVQAYSLWMTALLDFEFESWKTAIENFSTAIAIYKKLAEAVSDDVKEIYLQRCEEISANIRYCAYRVGDESAVEDLVKMRLEIGQEGLMTSRLDELIEKTRARQAEMLSEITWCGRMIPIKNEHIRVALLNLQQYKKQLDDSLSGVEQKLSVYESILKELIEAQQALRDELKDDQVFKAVSRGQQLSADSKIPSAIYLHTYLAYLRQTNTVERNLLMIESLKASKQGDGKKNRPQDYARLYEIIVQNLTEVLHLPGIEDQANLTDDINVQIVGYKAFKCYYIAQSYQFVKKWKESLALYERSLEYCRQSLEKYKHCHLDPSKLSKETSALNELIKTVDGLKYSVQASSILESHDVNNQLATAPTPACDLSKPLIERLHDYVEDPSLVSKKPNLVTFPPDFEPVPAKPLFFDLALSLVQFPSLEDKIEQKQQASGISGYLKGWLWGGKK